MKNKKTNIETPAEFYRMKRPEFFSDSEIEYQVQLTREHLTYELDQLSTNQKQDEFESLGRKLAEKFISPNLIPQVGPTGGGDGKTDSETYSVSQNISDRWFIPENGWSKDEKWAFAISCKKDWKGKIKSDVKNIVNTNRGYTRIYFITNQTPSSKLKKEEQDQLKIDHGIDVIILDREWILENVYSSDLIDLVVDTLNLSSIYKSKTINIGKNDAERIKQLSELEEKIKNPNRYFEYDFQLVEDAIETAILSRMLEKPRAEVEGKFDRAIRLCKKLNNNKQWIRLYYQLAWTHLNWYDDYVAFIEDFKNFKKHTAENISISDIELYVNLINLLKSISYSNKINLNDYKIKVDEELNELNKQLEIFASNSDKPSSSIIAKTYIAFLGLMDAIKNSDDSSLFIKDLSQLLSEGNKNLEYPFENFVSLIEIIGKVLINNQDFDRLIDKIAEISANRTSELASGQTFFKRAVQKLSSNLYKDSIVYFGKAIYKLAKEETGDAFYFSLIGLSKAFNNLGLLWASNAYLVAATSITIRSWYEKGKIDKRTYNSTKQLIINELIIGRFPAMLTWLELNRIISTQVEIDKQDLGPYDMIDACLSVRLLNDFNPDQKLFSILPELLELQNLWISQDACLYQLGYIDLLLKDNKAPYIIKESDLNTFYEMVANQPFKQQMLYKTDFYDGEIIELGSIILGTSFKIFFKRDKELLFAAESLMAYFESFFSTASTNIFPSSETVSIELIKDNNSKGIKFLKKEKSSEYYISLNESSFSAPSKDDLGQEMIPLIADILTKNFVLENPEKYFEQIFKTEEINERLSIIFSHRNFITNILGNDAKLFTHEWLKESFKEYPSKRVDPISFKIEENNTHSENDGVLDPDNLRHDKRKVFSLFDIDLWNNAKWQGFGFYGNDVRFGIFLGFENGELGKKIFEQWIQKFGKEDSEELIRITIIKGINMNQPFWYRVNIGSNIDHSTIQSGTLFTFATRFHEMQPETSTNLDNLISGFNKFKEYPICPAGITTDMKVEPYFELGILKKELVIKNAWEIGEHDLDRVAIIERDNPIIPGDVYDAPVLKLLKGKKSKNN